MAREWGHAVRLSTGQLLAGLVVLTILAGAALGVIITHLRRSEPVVPPRKRPAFVAPTDPGPVSDAADMSKSPAPDAAQRDVTSDASSADGCGQRLEPGLQTERISHELDAEPFALYVPESYDPDTPTPVLLALAGKNEDERAFLIDGGFTALADHKNILLIAPRTHSWEAVRSEDGADIQQMLERTAAIACVDRARVFAVGHQSGGHVATRLACRSWVMAAASASALPGRDAHPCEEPSPFILLSPLHSTRNPTKGGVQCNRSPVIPLQIWEKSWAKRNKCQRRDKTPYIDRPGGRCYQWDCAAEPLVTCELEGGHGWPGARTISAPLHHTFTPKCQPVAPADFPSALTAWSFFDSLPVNRDARKGARSSAPVDAN